MDKERGLDSVKLKKKRGQYILKDEGVIYRQIDYAHPRDDETVLEIGPGLGALTFKLAETAKKVVAIENDPDLYSYLKGRVPKNVQLVLADALKIDFPKFDVAVSNLPYQISSPVTFKLLKYNFDRAVLMYQKEFVLRMIAKSEDKDYCRLSVNVYYHADCRLLEYVPREAFYPIPKVDSAIIELRPRKPPFSVRDEELFFEIVRILFNNRRKKIKNSISSFILSNFNKKLEHDRSKLIEILDEIPYSDKRVEKLKPHQIGEIADALYSFLHGEHP